MANRQVEQQILYHQMKQKLKNDTLLAHKKQSTQTVITKTPRQHIVRREGLWKRLTGAPFEYIMMWIDDYESLDWDAFLTAATLNVILLCVKIAYRFDRPKLLNSEEFMERSHFGFKLEIIEYLLLSVSIINFLHLGLKIKKYRMFQHKTIVSDFNEFQVSELARKDKPRTTNAHLVDWNSDVPYWAESSPWSLIYPIYKYFFQNAVSGGQSKVWELHIWDPSPYSLHLFCYFSPPQVMVMMGLDSDNWKFYLPVAAFIACQVSIIVKIYTAYMKDKEVLFAEVANEYDQRFVYPNIFKQKRDVSTQTERQLEWHIMQ
ncbi:hypothetical protein G9A89_016559 [Geosiphon pyriformis]|nr:hypothetical protein G9A89_016559 [Geosiphon pyriformis]